LPDAADWAADGYRLPTEAELMWAVMGAPSSRQGGNTDTLGWFKGYAGSTEEGIVLDNIDLYVWHSGNSNDTTRPVGGKIPNELQLFDMSGNVDEWCWDWYSGYYTGPSETGLLTDYRGPLSKPTPPERVIRGAPLMV
jgi:formylglycine-generating enzyme required for sulfatase activity